MDKLPYTLECPTCGAHEPIQYLYSTRTLLNYPQIYDANGININPDGNITTTIYRCLHCNHEFSVQTKFGEMLSCEPV